MKSCKLFAILLLMCSSSIAQLNNTRWKGEISIPDPTTVLFDFKKESVTIFYAGDQPMNIPDANGNEKSVTAKDSAVIEVMTYKVQHDTLSMQKLSGHSPCDQQTVGLYQIVKKESSLQMNLLKDGCNQRGQAFDNKTLLLVTAP